MAPARPAFCYDFCFPCVLLCVEDVVLNLRLLQHSAKQLTHFHARCAHQHRAAHATQGFNFVNNRLILFALRFVNKVLLVFPRDGAVGRNAHNIQLVDFPELARLRFRCTGHAAQLVVHPEVILQRHRREGLRSGFHVHIFLRLNGLVQVHRNSGGLPKYGPSAHPRFSPCRPSPRTQRPFQKAYKPSAIAG